MESNLLAIVSNNFLLTALVSVIIVITASTLYVCRSRTNKTTAAAETSTKTQQKSQEKRNKSSSNNNSSSKRKTQATRNENGKPQTQTTKKAAVTAEHVVEKKESAPSKVTKNVAANKLKTIKSNTAKQQQIAQPPAKVDKVKPTAVERETEFGAWTTVLNKKQKKQSNNDPLIEAVAAASKGHTLKPKSTKKSSDKKSKADKQLTEIPSSHTAVSANVDSLVTVPVQTSGTFESVKPPTPAPTTTLDDKVVIDSAAGEPPTQSVTNATSSSPVEPPKATSNTTSSSPSEAVPQTLSNMVFDELGDAAWIETKPQKKSKRRALRE